MSENITITAQGDHVQQWAAIKRTYVAKRGSDASKLGKAIPRTTNGDVAVLSHYWNAEARRELMRTIFANDRSRSSLKQWSEAKDKIDRYVNSADKAALYPENEWFWDTALLRLAIYLESCKAIPSSTDLMIESLTETLSDHADTAKKLAQGAVGAVTSAGEGLISTVKTGALIVGGVVAAAVVVPPIIRAFRD